MQLAGFVVLIPTLIAKICFARLIIKTTKLDEPLVEASIEILESCYTDRIGTVGIAGPSSGRIIGKISSRKTVIPTTLMDETSRPVTRGPVDRVSRNKLQAFAVTVTDPKTLVKTLAQVKSSTWWNHMASFLLIDSAGTIIGCSNAYETLWEAWKMNLLNSKFLCLHETRGKLIYTFNPYTSTAPGPWQHENTYKGPNDHVWTLLVREYHEDESRCDGLDFDKTGNLGGYKIRAAVVGMEHWWFADPTKKPAINFRVENITAHLLMDSLNATWKLSLYPLSTFGPGRDFVDIENKIVSGIIDILFLIGLTNPSAPHGWTYPFHPVEFGVITQYLGHKSQLEKLISVLDNRSRFGVCAVLMITLLFFKCWLRKPLIPAILNLVLLVCNASLPGIPQKIAPRIYLASLFMFVVTIHGIYLGRLASLLTKKVRLPTVESFDDLVRSDHTIYATNMWFPFFDQPTFEGRVSGVALEPCRKVSQDVNAACADSKPSLISIAARYNLHLSQESMGVRYTAYPIRNDWPLEERVNAVYERLAAAGIQNRLYARTFQSEMDIIESYERQDHEPELKVLTLEHLGFAFLILAIGLGCATITFIIEVAIFRTAIARPPKRIRRRIQIMK